MNNKQHVLVISFFTAARDIQDRINSYLEDGWSIVSITAQHVSTGSSQYMDGGYIVVLQQA